MSEMPLVKYCETCDKMLTAKDDQEVCVYCDTPFGKQPF